MTTTDSIWAAAEHLLRRDAEELRESSTLASDPDDWTGEEEAKADYDEHIAAADALASLSTAAAQPPRSRDLSDEDMDQIAAWVGEHAHGDIGYHALADRIIRLCSTAAQPPAGWREALEFYAQGRHFGLSDESAWDTVSGEPQNFWCDEAGTATIEDGTVAAMALRGTPLTDEETAPKAEPAAVAPEYPQMPETWHVDAHVLGEKILSIGNDWLSGKDELTEAEEQAVIGMAQTLLSFVGYGMPPSSFDPDADDDDGQAQRDQEVGRQWRLNSSLEKWFPLTAERLERLQAAFAARVDASEREAFEAQFPVPGGVNWNGSEYVVEDDCLNSYRCDRFVGQWAAWQARASSGQAPAPAVQQVEPLAWMDDGTLRAGSEATAYRVVTDATRRGMTASLAASFITPLYAHPAAPAAQGDALTPEDADQLEKVINDFDECGETDVPYTALQRYAAMGYLECSHYHVLPAARAAIDAARAAKEGAKHG